MTVKSFHANQCWKHKRISDSKPWSSSLFTRLSHLSECLGFCCRKGEIINTLNNNKKIIFPGHLDKNKKENKHI